MDLDIIYSSLVADKMSRENWGGSGCSPAWFALAVILYLVVYGSYMVYRWAEDKLMDMGYELGIIENSTDIEVTVGRVAIVCGIILFWVLLFALLWHFAERKKRRNS